MDCGKPGGEPPASELPRYEPMSVGEALLSSGENCQRTANGIFAPNPGKWPLSLLGDGIPQGSEGAGQRIRSSLAEGVSKGGRA